MRSDYGLYVVAVVCFIIAGVFAASAVPGYTPAKAEGITVITIFLLLGIISAVLGYSARPKAIMPITQPKPAPVSPAIKTPPALTQPPPAEEPTPKPQAEEVSLEAAPPEPPPPSPVVVTIPPKPEPSAKVAEEEKPKEKPVRRRRKKAQ